MTREELERELARCDREIEEYRNQPGGEKKKAYLTTMGILDWEYEKRILLRKFKEGEAS